MAQYLYVGGWNYVAARGTLGFSRGIYAWRVEGDARSFTPLGLVAETVCSATDLATTPDGRYLYATEFNGGISTRSWPFPGAPRAGLTSYSICRETGALKKLNSVDSLGDMPTEIGTDATGNTLALVNFYEGNVVTYRIREDGAIGDVISNIKHGVPESDFGSSKSRAHGLAFSADNKSLYVADRGLNRIYVYDFDPSTSRIISAVTPFLQFEGDHGPRHLTAHPFNECVYVVSEESGLVHVLTRAASGLLHLQQSISLLPSDSTIKIGAAHLHVSPDGLFLYANHRTSESVAAFSIDQQDGHLTFLGSSETSARSVLENDDVIDWNDKTLWQKVQTGARVFAMNDDASWLAFPNMGEDAVLVLARDRSSGILSSTDNVLPTPQPCSILIVRPK
ncbi:lactonase family protein [Paraburkholderia fynbosensis]|uniref:6-phosphogluconolactonase n=1 Tax=Paraburkholderia fynbosensis TaxID=1200993 RepID=A0A6J5GY42_9BURK|nr:beta-propeller fold lactonase family protein [Paraburkholderia fynbosensis]CAB3807014.1 6-phosphogluconolactonase [Paraburkholderia fynbosensis]